MLTGILAAPAMPCHYDIASLRYVYFVRQGGGGLSGVGAAAAGGIGAFSGNMHFGNMPGMSNLFGGGCQKVDRVRVPDTEPKWSCGLDVSGRWTCAGGPLVLDCQ